MILSFGLAMMLGAAQRPALPTGEINASFRPARIAKILPDLSKVIGVKLSVDPALADDAVMIDVANVSPRAFLDMIASVLYAKWEVKDKGFVLMPDKAKLKEAGVREISDRAKKISDAIDRLQPAGSATSGSPGPIGNLLSLIGTKTLAELELDTRHVFALRPNARQEQLPSGSVDILEGAAASRAIKPNQGDAQTPEIGQAILVLQVEHDVLTCDLLAANNAGVTQLRRKAIFELHPGATLPAPTGETIVLDPVEREFLFRALGLSSSGQNIRSSAVGASVDHGMRQPAIQFSASNGDSLEQNPKLSDVLRKRLMDPLGDDPFWIVFSPLDGAAQLDRANLVAYLPDYSFERLARYLATAAMDEGGFIKTICPNAGLSVQETPGWMTVSPSEPVYAAQSHIDRAALGKLMETAGSRNALSLDDIGAYSLAQRTPMSNRSLDDLYLRALNKQIWIKASNDLSDPGMARIYASLTPAQKGVLAAHRWLGLNDLSPDQQAWLESVYYNSKFPPTIQDARGPVDPLQYRPISDLAQERTMALPDGIPATVRFSLTEDGQPAYWATDEKSGVSSFLTSDRLASQLYQRERPELAYLGVLPHFDSFVPAVSQVVQLRFELTPTILLAKKLEGNSIEPDAQSLRYNDLPDSFRSAVDRSLKDMEQALNSMTFGSRKKAPPPPRL